jgi:bacterioferritin (cytochrome b1)
MDWVGYFTHNRAHRLGIPWERGVTVEPRLRSALVRSLQRFQMGERGDGAHLKRVAAALGDPAYARAIDLFVEEEQEHAELAARVLQALGAPLLESHWSDHCFRVICLMPNLRVELTVLLVAEIIAKRYFRALHDSTEDPVLRATCAQILRDEEAHIAFHADTLRPMLSSLPGPARLLARAAWRLFFACVCLVVVYDHRAFLRRSGVSLRAFQRDCLGIFDAVAWYVFDREVAASNPAIEL